MDVGGLGREKVGAAAPDTAHPRAATSRARHQVFYTLAADEIEEVSIPPPPPPPPLVLSGHAASLTPY